MGVALYNQLAYNSIYIHYALFPLHPPLMNIEKFAGHTRSRGENSKRNMRKPCPLNATRISPKQCRRRCVHKERGFYVCAVLRSRAVSQLDLHVSCVFSSSDCIRSKCIDPNASISISLQIDLYSLDPNASICIRFDPNASISMFGDTDDPPKGHPRQRLLSL